MSSETAIMAEDRARAVLNLKGAYDAGMVDNAYARLASMPDADGAELTAARTSLLVHRVPHLRPVAYADTVSEYRKRVARMLASTDPNGLSHMVRKWEKWESLAGIVDDIFAPSVEAGSLWEMV